MLEPPPDYEMKYMRPVESKGHTLMMRSEGRKSRAAVLLLAPGFDLHRLSSGPVTLGVNGSAAPRVTGRQTLLPVADQRDRLVRPRDGPLHVEDVLLWS